jgi:hypothetical protein
MKEKLKSYAAKLVTVLKALFVGLFSKAKSLFLNSSLKTKIYAGVAILLIVLFGVILCQAKSIKTLKYERNVYKNNETVLLTKSRQYKKKIDQHAATVSELQLKLSEYKKFRSNDASLIKSLQIKGRNLESVVSVGTKTTIPLKVQVKDSIVYRNKVIHDTLKCITINEPYYYLHGSIDNNRFTGEMSVRDSLIIVETVKYKHFLGFLWKISKVKNRKIDVVSNILGVDYITIKK